MSKSAWGLKFFYHKRLEKLEIYLSLINFERDKSNVAYVKSLNEENKLIKVGFEYLRYSNKYEIAIYRKCQ